MKNEIVILSLGGSLIFPDEIDVEFLSQASKSFSNLNNNVEKININNRTIFLLGNGNLLNLSAADGNPIEIMDMGLGLQSLCAEAIVKKYHLLGKNIQSIPESINNKMARMCLKYY